MKRSTSHRRGVAMVMAIALLGLVAAAIATLTIGLSGNFTRLRSQRDQIQSQQYELASVLIAQDQAKSDRLVNGVLPLPPEAGPATIAWSPDAGGTRACTITISGREEQYAFRQVGTGWVLQK